MTAAIEGSTSRIGYHPVRSKKEVPGFVENRILYAIMRECLDLVDEGVIDAEGLDLRALGHRLQARGDPADPAARHGRARHLHGVASYLNTDLSNESGVSSTATGPAASRAASASRPAAGFFDYTPEQINELQRPRARRARRRPQGAELTWARQARVRLLDNGTLVIDQSHIMWNIGGGHTRCGSRSTAC